MKSTYWRLLRFWPTVLLLFLASPVIGASTEDGYIAGYATAVLDQEFHLAAGSITVENGVITVAVNNVAGAERDRMIAALRKIPGVHHVEVVPKAEGGATAAGAPGSMTVRLSPPQSNWFPRGQLFDALHADTRWPHFAPAVRQYLNRGEGSVKTAFAGDFGETLALYRNGAPFSGQWELGIQAAVFSLFDLGSDTKQLINADYIVGLIASYRSGDWSAFVRYHHQSSHLGDEFVLSRNIERVNLSYEMIDGKLSYDILDTVRLYGGAGALIRRDPSDIDPWRTQYGIEVQSPRPLYRGVRPVAYADFQTHEQTKWSTNISLRTGLQFENLRILHRKLQFLLEYYNGYSPNGQFYMTRIETIGLGLHLYF
jgi:hypothetical protein